MGPQESLALAIYVGFAFASHDAIAKASGLEYRHEVLTCYTMLWGLPLVGGAALLLGAGISAKAAVYYALAGILNFSFGRTLLYTAIRILGSSGGSTMSSTSAVFGAILGWLIAGENPDLRVWAGVFLILAAAYLASGGLERRSLKGIAAGLGNGFLIALGIVLARLGNLSGGHPVTGIALAYLAGSASAVLMSLNSGSLRSGLTDSRVSLMGILAASGQISRYFALTVLGASVVAPLQNTRPLIATALLAAVGRSDVRPGKHHWAAAVLVLVGVYMIASSTT